MKLSDALKLTLLYLGCGPITAFTFAQEAPHIIYVIVDDMGYSDLGCYGGEIETPRLDRFADEGLLFRQHYTYAKCETSRTALMSGMFHHKAGLKMPLAKGAKTLAEVLDLAGYRSYVSGKWHVDHPQDRNYPTDRGFDGFYGLMEGASSHFSPYAQGKIFRNKTQLKAVDQPANYYTTKNFTDEGIAFIQNSLSQHPNDPFFLYLAYTAPHSPIQAPASLVQKYRGRYSIGWDVVHQNRIDKMRRLGVFPEKWTPSLRDEDIPAWDSLSPALQDEEDFRMAAYAAMVESIDSNFGRLLDFLEDPDGDPNTDDSIAANTLIYFVGDNGASPFPRTPSSTQAPDSEGNSQWRTGPGWAWVSNTPFRYHKQSQFNGGVLTPMIVRWPAAVANPGSIVDYPTHLIDFMSTVVEIADVDYTRSFPHAPALDGLSILPIFEGVALEPEQRPVLGFEFATVDFAFMEYPWKIASYRREPWQLFNLEKDRAETKNLALEEPDRLADMAAAYLTWVQERNAPANTYFSGTEVDTSIYAGREERYQLPKTNTLWSPLLPAYTVTSIGSVTTMRAEEESNTGLLRAVLNGIRIGQTSDDFGFIHKPFFGDGELIVKIVEMTGGGENRRAGVMLRESLDPNAPFVLAEINHNGGSPNARLRYRTSAGAFSAQIPDTATHSLPVWIRLVRQGDVFTASYSTDARQYTEFGQINLALPLALNGGVALNTQTTSSTGTMRVTRPYIQSVSDYPSRDLDGDGITEGQAFLSGGAENAFNFPTTLHFDSGRLRIGFLERIDSDQISYTIEASGALGSWSDVSGDWIIDTADGIPINSKLVFNTYEYSETLPASAFYRIRARFLPVSN